MVDTLADWLAYLESRHPQAIDLGLERVAAVRDRLGLFPDWPIITVGGTNGKGSTCAYLEAVLSDAGYRIACYTSPHLLRYNERVRVAGEEASDADLVAAFRAVETARGDLPLSYFEHGTLAAMWLFRRAQVDGAVLEVGLGGRLDAVNAWDADCAVVTAVDLDHQDYLGPDREAIGLEKAGILRAACPAVIADADPPRSLLRHAASIGASMLRLGEEIRVEAGEGGGNWTCRVAGQTYPALPLPALPGRFQLDNAAAAVAALAALRARLPVTMQALRGGIARARPPGRCQWLPGPPGVLLDVAHNPHAARALAGNLASLAGHRRIIAVLGILRDKDVAGVIQPLLPLVDEWHAAGLAGPRARSGASLAEALSGQGARRVHVHDDVRAAWASACASAAAADIICVFGSFYTVAQALALLAGRDVPTA